MPFSCTVALVSTLPVMVIAPAVVESSMAVSSVIFISTTGGFSNLTPGGVSPGASFTVNSIVPYWWPSFL